MQVIQTTLGDLTVDQIYSAKWAMLQRSPDSISVSSEGVLQYHNENGDIVDTDATVTGTTNVFIISND